MHTVRLAILLLILPTLAQAQWRSVHAVETTTETVTKDGTVRSITTRGEYFRSTSGSELTIEVVRKPDGTLEKTADLYDAEAPAQYRLNYQAKTASLVARMSAPRPMMTDRSERHPNLQHASWQGLDCVLVPAMLDGKTRMGAVWVDDQDDLIVRKDIQFPGNHMVMELSDITMDYQYDPSLFRVPADFRIDTSGAVYRTAGN